MSRHYSDHDSDEASLGPQLHRREIELMEQRFRQRSDRTGASSATSGIDEQVQEEMRQFFTESAQRLEEVVPTLQETASADSVETTGEIRRKIDAFFGEDDAPSTDSPVLRRPARPAPEFADLEPEPPAPERAWATPAPAHERDDRSFGEARLPRATGVRRSAPQPPQPPRPPRRAGTSDDGGAKMDLKTALERLRKHGVVRDDAELSDSPSVEAARDTVRRSVTAMRESVRAPTHQPPTHQPPEHPAQDRRPPNPQSPRRPAPDRQARGSASPPTFAHDVVTRIPHGGMHDDGPDDFDFAPRLEPLPEPAPESEGFDEIFAEVEGLVRGTLRDSVEETFGEARAAEEDMRSATASQVEPAAFPPPPAPVAAPAPPAASRFLPRPSDDDEDDEDLDEAPLQPYDWGVQASKRPPGAWLLQDGAEDAARNAAAQRSGVERDEEEREEPVAFARPERVAEPETSIPLPPLGGVGGGGSSGMGARGLLARQLDNEARRFQPCIDRLVERGVLDASDVDEETDDDDEVSVASFKDNRPRGDEVGMTPMRIVEEIRRLRRVQEALIRKGILTEDEIASTTHDG